MNRPFYRKKRYIFTFIILLLVGGLWTLARGARAKAQARRLASLVPAAPQRGLLTTKTQATGTVEPENRVLVTPSVSGRAEEVLFTEGQLLKKGQVLAWVSSSERSALLDSLKMKDTSPEEKKMVEEAYNLTPVVAPIDGMAVRRSVEPGQSVSAAKELAVISDRLIVKTFVDETDIGSVKEGQAAEFYLDAFPKDKRLGRVLAIAHESSQKDGVTGYEVKILPAGAADVMRSGMTADVLIVTGSKKDALTVPRKAVKYKDGEPYVSVKLPPSGKLTDRKIKTGPADESRVEVVSGLTEKDTVYYSTGPGREFHSFSVSAE